MSLVNTIDRGKIGARTNRELNTTLIALYQAVIIGYFLLYCLAEFGRETPQFSGINYSFITAILLALLLNKLQVSSNLN